MRLRLTNFKTKTRKIVFKRYDLLEKNVKTTLKNYGLKRLPLVTFNEYADRITFKAEEMEELKTLGNFCEQFNLTVYLMKDFAAQNGKTFGDNCVSLKEVHDWIAAAKVGFIQGQNEGAKS